MRVPEWIWIILAIPTLASLIVAAWAGLVTLASRRRRWYRHPPAIDVVIQPNTHPKPKRERDEAPD
jgi:threonine/homoserine/homoserine lactone efflux protein